MAILLLMAATMASATPTEAQVQRELKSAPHAIRDFLERRAGCNHWAGEEPYDAERAAYIAKAVRELRCRQIEADEKLIKRRYAKSRCVLWLLKTTRDWDTIP